LTKTKITTKQVQFHFYNNTIDLLLRGNTLRESLYNVSSERKWTHTCQIVVGNKAIISLYMQVNMICNYACSFGRFIQEIYHCSSGCILYRRQLILFSLFLFCRMKCNCVSLAHQNNNEITQQSNLRFYKIILCSFSSFSFEV